MPFTPLRIHGSALPVEQATQVELESRQQIRSKDRIPSRNRFELVLTFHVSLNCSALRVDDPILKYPCPLVESLLFAKIQLAGFRLNHLNNELGPAHESIDPDDSALQ